MRETGALPVLAGCVNWGARWAVGAVRGPDNRTFAYEGREVPYFWDRYNHTWLNERSVELALARSVITTVSAARTIEVGNVLAHHLPVTHRVFDKYEQAAGVHNLDVLDIELPEPIDLIISISTLEHVGQDEDLKEPDKALRAVEHLRSLLAPGGRLWATLPVGYNLSLDAQLRGGELPFTRLTALKRVSAANDWRQVELDEVWCAPYDWLVFTAHGLLVAELEA
jgi:hypothetical protein